MNVLLIGLLVVVWWMGVWGFLETLLHTYIKNMPLVVYGSMILFVLLIVWARPGLLEHFI